MPHLVVIDPGKNGGALVQLEQRHSHGPEVDGFVVLQPHHDLRSAVPATHEVRRRVVVRIGNTERRPCTVWKTGGRGMGEGAKVTLLLFVAFNRLRGVSVHISISASAACFGAIWYTHSFTEVSPCRDWCSNSCCIFGIHGYMDRLWCLSMSEPLSTESRPSKRSRCSALSADTPQGQHALLSREKTN